SSFIFLSLMVGCASTPAVPADAPSESGAASIPSSPEPSDSRPSEPESPEPSDPSTPDANATTADSSDLTVLAAEYTGTESALVSGFVAQLLDSNTIRKESPLTLTRGSYRYGMN